MLNAAEQNKIVTKICAIITDTAQKIVETQQEIDTLTQQQYIIGKTKAQIRQIASQIWWKEEEIKEYTDWLTQATKKINNLYFTNQIGASNFLSLNNHYHETLTKQRIKTECSHLTRYTNSTQSTKAYTPTTKTQQ